MTRDMSLVRVLGGLLESYAGRSLDDAEDRAVVLGGLCDLLEDMHTAVMEHWEEHDGGHKCLLCQAAELFDADGEAE